jgi:hypothetical protein
MLMGEGTMRRNYRIVALVAAVLLLASPLSAEPSDDTVGQIIGILKEKGLIDQEEEERLLMKHASRSEGSESAAMAKFLDGWDFYGDFRLRHELFTYRHDPYGNHNDNRYRFRYRARLGFEKVIADKLVFGMRFATGGTPSTSEDRSTNQTLGRQEDFDYDSMRIDRAYIDWEMPEWNGLRTRFVGGKMANPFVWNKGKDLLQFDADIQPEGGALKFDYPIDERSRLFANMGFYIIDENSSGADPKLVAVQLGGETKLGAVDLGLRSSMYWWRSLDSDYIFRAQEFGNLPTAYQGGKARVGDVTAYLETDLSDDWPMLIYGTFSKNFTADSGYCTVFDAALDGDVDPINCDGPGFSGGLPAGSVLGESSTGAEDDAWGVGLELGSSKKIGKIGFGYFYVEANAVQALFTDSDILDGFTNRRGWVIYGGRKLTTNTEFKFAYYQGKYIERDGAFFLSGTNSKRSRLQTDVLFKF